MNDFDVVNFLKGFAIKKESKNDIIQKYLKGLISKDEFFKRMKDAQ